LAPEESGSGAAAAAGGAVGAAAALAALALLILLLKKRKKSSEIPDDEAFPPMEMEDEEMPRYASEYGMSQPGVPQTGEAQEDPVPQLDQEMEEPVKYKSEYGMSDAPAHPADGGGEPDPQAPRAADELEGEEVYKSESNPDFDVDPGRAE
jgi:hypothetical protein